MAALLPMELIINILSLLPVKPLKRFECVSKSFYSLIRSPDFIKLHLRKTLASNSRRHLFIATTSLHSAALNNGARRFRFAELDHPIKSSTAKRPPSSKSLFSDEPPPGIQFLGSCHGVICVCDWAREDIFLINPATRTYRKLPPSNGAYSSDFANFGFGYDSGSDDYKVLRMTQCCGPNDEVYNETKVYTLKTNSWRRVGDLPYFTIYRDNHHGVLVNEGLHYIVSEVAYEMNRKSIARFDIRTETFSLVDRPPDYEDALGSWTLYLGELHGCLSFTVNYDFHGRAEVWMMMEYGKEESWLRLLHIQKPGSGVNLIQIRPITCSSDGEKILTELDNRQLCWYDMRKKTKDGIQISGQPDEDFNTGVFVETLVSVVDDDHKQSWKQESVPRQPRKPKKKNDVDGFLKVGFKLRL